MLIFILDKQNPAALEYTLNSLAKCRIKLEHVIVEDDVISQIQSCLNGYTEEYFVTLTAGESLPEAFWDDIEQTHTADVMQVYGIFIWNARSVRKLKLEAYDKRLPFPRLSFYALYAMLKNAGDSLSPAFNHFQDYIWMKRENEEQWVKPIVLSRPRSIYCAAPEISIVICTYNDAQYLPWAVRSVVAQTFSNWELIIIDDASTDGTRQVTSDLEKFPWCRIYRNNENIGKARSLNKALQECRGKWMLELDADDWLTVDCLEKLHEYAESLSKLLYTDRLEWIERPNYQLVYKDVIQSPPNLSKHKLLTFGAPIAARMYSVEALQMLNGWDVSDPFGGRLYEDLQIILRLGVEAATRVPFALYNRRLRQKSITTDKEESFIIWAKWMSEYSTTID